MNMNTENKKTSGTKSDRVREKITHIFSVLCSNSVIISGKKDSFTLPLIIFVLLLLALPGFTVTAVLVSLFCGVEYTFSGDDFASSPKMSFR